jgi:hypothetical protein
VDSYSLAHALQALGIPFVFATGYGSSGLRPEWRAAPVVQKPFSARDLERVMRQALADRRGREPRPR